MESRAELLGHPIDVLAAPYGTIVWFAISPGTRAERIGAVDGIGNVVVARVDG